MGSGANTGQGILRFGQDRSGQGDVAQSWSLLLGCFAEGVVEGALQDGQLGRIAIFVEQHPGEGDDWIAGAGNGIADGEIVSQVDRGQGLAGLSALLQLLCHPFRCRRCQQHAIAVVAAGQHQARLQLHEQGRWAADRMGPLALPLAHHGGLL